MEEPQEVEHTMDTHQGEDVFLNLANNESEDETTVKLNALPSPPASRAGLNPNIRPRSSGRLLPGSDNARPSSALGRKHARNQSQPLSANLTYESISQRDSLVTRPEMQLRRTTERSDGHDGPLFGRRRPSYMKEDEDTHPQLVSEKPGSNISPARSDSVESQTAQSTVWDELDELKSRIKNLEFGGKRPNAMNTQSSERPRTATTAPTTISTSPHQARKSSNTATEVTIGASSAIGVHPLLHSALAKARAVVSPQIYRALEASATDAIAFAVMTGGAGPQGTAYSAASIINGATVSDRSMRRKADSMCRNLTDLCIALCDLKSDQTQPMSSPISVKSQQRERPASRYERRSLDPEERSPQTPGEPRSRSGRTMSSLSGRRTSLGRSFAQQRSPQDIYPRSSELQRSPSTVAKDYAAQYSLAGHGLTRARVARLEEEHDTDPNGRAPSKAMTEVGQSRQSLSHRRDFSNAGQQRSPSLRETLAARRANASIPEIDTMSEAQRSSFMAQAVPARKNCLDRVRGPASEVGASPSSERRRFASLEHARAGSRLDSPLGRTVSLSRRSNVAMAD